MAFNVDTYRARRQGLIKKVGKGFILLPGNSDSPRNFEHNPYFFTQDSTFLYYTGISTPDLLLLLDCESGDSVLFGNEASLDHKIWMGPSESLVEKGERCGLSKIYPLKELSDWGGQFSKRKVHYLPPYRSDQTMLLATILGAKIGSIVSGTSIELIKAVISQREIKSTEEIHQMVEAVEMTKKMHVNVMKSTVLGKTERYLMSLVEQTALSEGGRAAYSPIVSVRGEILHNLNYNNKLKEGQLLLGDFGAMIDSGYAGDITRTIPASGKFSNKQKEIYQIVLNAQEKAVQMLMPGISFKEVHLAACAEIVNGLKDLGLMKGNTADAVATGAHALFFPHGLGHMIGLDVHDMENLGEENVGYDADLKKSKEFGLKSLRLGKNLREGFVITVEPGIYFIPELYHYWKSSNHTCSEFLNYDKISDYLDFGGVRIEDEYVIKTEGSQLLGNAIPKTIDEVETVMLG